ncbi:type II toxin-antitoxin system RelE/ParE family toxin [Oceanobacillus sp. HCA-5259]|uniref:type II toxin-antitoxin system RelE/ParE family toxin n=1 Tax=Oceanobacillus sp. HCA-5259 TaxID=3134661 RepID=UPI0030C561F5
MAELRWSKLAVNDLADIISYISQDSKENAKVFVAEILILLKQLTFPYSGRVEPELNDEIIREKVFNNFALFTELKIM